MFRHLRCRLKYHMKRRTNLDCSSEFEFPGDLTIEELMPIEGKYQGFRFLALNQYIYIQ